MCSICTERDFWDSEVTLYLVDRARAEEAVASQIKNLSASRSEVCALQVNTWSRHLTGTFLGYRNTQILWLSQELVNFQ